jgi:hypothetical protein
MKGRKVPLAGALILAVIASNSQAAGSNPLHMSPYTFLFGNHIDTHQETKLENDGSLKGRFYIYFTGETDAVSGLPVARHPRGAGHDEECGVDPIDCVVGWEIRAVPAEAKFLSHSGVNGNDHPIWMMSSRSAIPQPGSYTHFHWITSSSTDDRYDTVPQVCDVQMAGQLEGTVLTGELTLEDGFPAISWPDVDVHVEDGAEDVCPGWLLQITARRSFAFQHGGEKVPVLVGVDNASHLNIVTNYAIIPAITGEHGGGEH